MPFGTSGVCIDSVTLSLDIPLLAPSSYRDVFRRFKDESTRYCWQKKSCNFDSSET